MQKKSIKFSFYLIFFSFIAKAVSFISRIYLARNIDATAMSYYTILSPTIVILISMVQMGIPSSLSKLVADKNYHLITLSTSIYFSIFTTFLTTIIYLLAIPFLSAILFKENIFSLFYSVLPFLPLVSLSGLLKGYLMGKQKFIASAFSQVVEEIARIIFLAICFIFFTPNSSLEMAKIAIFSISIAEFFSSIFMITHIFIHRKKQLYPLHYSNHHLKQILTIALPMSSSRFIGSFSYFIEPMLMNISLNLIQSKAMMIKYGILNGYVLPLLTMPSFITITLSNYLLPSFTYHYSRNNKNQAVRLFLQVIYFCLFIGMIYGLILYFFPNEICNLFYSNTNGAMFLKKCSIPFIVYSIQPVLSIMMHALNHSKASTIDTLIGCVSRLLIIAFLSPILYENALILGLVCGMLITTGMHFIRILLIKRKH